MNTSISKKLTLVLRHKPWLLNLNPDSKGFVPLDELLNSFERRWGVPAEDVLRVLLSDQERFEVVDRRVRARYGHSFPVDPGRPLKPEEVPEKLYHGTVESSWRRIVKEGIKPMGRTFVHLSLSVERALQVASRRRGRKVVLAVDAKRLAERYKVWKASKLVYLTEYVPPDLIKVEKIV